MAYINSEQPAIENQMNVMLLCKTTQSQTIKSTNHKDRQINTNVSISIRFFLLDLSHCFGEGKRYGRFYPQDIRCPF